MLNQKNFSGGYPILY